MKYCGMVLALSWQTSLKKSSRCRSVLPLYDAMNDCLSVKVDIFATMLFVERCKKATARMITVLADQGEINKCLGEIQQHQTAIFPFVTQLGIDIN